MAFIQEVYYTSFVKYAIYFLAIGSSARACLELAYCSLRKSGFKNDVYILCDKESVPFKIAENTEILKIRNKHLNLEEISDKPLSLFDVRQLDTSNPRNVQNPKKWTICRAKTLIDMYVSFDQYDYIIYLDVDVLTDGSVEKLEHFLLQNRGSIITARNQEGKRLGGKSNFLRRKFKRVKTFSSANLTFLELFRYWFAPAICSDVVCIPTDSNGKKMMQEWRKECLKNIDYVQPALQAVLLRYFRDIHILAPYTFFGYGPRHAQYNRDKVLSKVDSVFVHFGGAIKDSSAFKRYYQRYIKNKKQ